MSAGLNDRSPLTPSARGVVTLLPSMLRDLDCDPFDINALMKKARTEGVDQRVIASLLRRMIEVLSFPEVRDLNQAHELQSALRLIEKLVIRLATDRTEAAFALDGDLDPEQLEAIIEHLRSPQAVRIY